MTRVITSRPACSTVPARHISAQALKPLAAGCTMSITPANPTPMAIHCEGRTRSLKSRMAISVMNRGVAMLMAVALASGMWNIAVR